MKKLLILSMVLTMTATLSAQADEPKTYTGQFIQKHTQKIVDTEKRLQEKQEAREETLELQRQQRSEVLGKQHKQIEDQKKQREEASKARKQKIEQKNNYGIN